MADIRQDHLDEALASFRERRAPAHGIRLGKGGHIVNTASLAAFIANEPAGIYCPSKFAVRGLSEALRGALANTTSGSRVCVRQMSTQTLPRLHSRDRRP
jgi:short-subunit dehydrogenase